MQDRKRRIDQMKQILLSPNGLAKIIELHKLVCGGEPRMERSPYAIIEAIADCEYEQRTGRKYQCS